MTTFRDIESNPQPAHDAIAAQPRSFRSSQLRLHPRVQDIHADFADPARKYAAFPLLTRHMAGHEAFWRVRLIDRHGDDAEWEQVDG